MDRRPVPNGDGLLDALQVGSNTGASRRALDGRVRRPRRVRKRRAGRRDLPRLPGGHLRRFGWPQRDRYRQVDRRQDRPINTSVALELCRPSRARPRHQGRPVDQPGTALHGPGQPPTPETAAEHPGMHPPLGVLHPHGRSAHRTVRPGAPTPRCASPPGGRRPRLRKARQSSERPTLGLERRASRIARGGRDGEGHGGRETGHRTSSRSRLQVPLAPQPLGQLG